MDGAAGVRRVIYAYKGHANMNVMVHRRLQCNVLLFSFIFCNTSLHTEQYDPYCFGLKSHALQVCLILETKSTALKQPTLNASWAIEDRVSLKWSAMREKVQKVPPPKKSLLAFFTPSHYWVTLPANVFSTEKHNNSGTRPHTTHCLV